MVLVFWYQIASDDDDEAFGSVHNLVDTSCEDSDDNRNRILLGFRSS